MKASGHRKTRSRKIPASRIKAVIFDMGNVLLNYDARKAARQFAKACDVPLWKVWLHFFTSPTEKAFTRGEISSTAFYRHAKQALKIPVDYKTFCHYWNDIFWENKGIEAVLRRLRKKKYPLYVISNTNRLHFNHIKKKFKILRYFKKTFPSHEVGSRKPDREIYRKVLARIQWRPEETVFIDDAREFVDGAKRVGMHAVRYRNPRQLVKDLRRLGIKI